MSTRANVLIKDNRNALWFYRHYDGGPEGALPTLCGFMRRVKSGEIRNNVMQAAGWLIVTGREEYKKHPPSWKVGAYELTTCRHGDIKYLYTLDLIVPSIKVESVNGFDNDQLLTEIGTLTEFSQDEIDKIVGDR